ncbi:ABC transporter substrate-binding protein [Billgrantia gudaonensis]|uniref:Iron(III) transport system substrate-binding protein n=1 Tax=Billgrantia gudaonensis TaxID=376427 RepID=A0A1G8V642_9GAMM|nr:ABC transporter substrate-binding protein [Halomonas gudaonensis]SDJ61324.1 iron(III) transport system substrate-binding protein [Halomonas gudaonensis]
MMPTALKRLTSALLLALWSLAASGEETLHLHAESGTGQTPLVIGAALDLHQARPLLEDFHRRHPHLDITYRNLTTLELHQRFLDAPDAADVVLSSAMPWQYRLANDGHAQPLDSDIAHAWPAWARWRHELFAFTFEPIVMVVHRDFTERFGELESHGDLLERLADHPRALAGRVVTYDPQRSGAGYTYAIEESRLSPRYWDLVAVLGQARTALAETTGEMLEGLASGRYLVGYNLLGSYVRDAVADHPELTIVVPEDYALVVQRLAFIPRQAPHPEAARLFLDYLLGETGQRTIAERTQLGAVHPDLEGPGTAAALREKLGDALRPIALGPGLLATLDDLKREALLTRWQREFDREGPAFR